MPGDFNHRLPETSRSCDAHKSTSEQQNPTRRSAQVDLHTIAQAETNHSATTTAGIIKLLLPAPFACRPPGVATNTASRSLMEPNNRP